MNAPRRFAERTNVPIEASRAELEGLLNAHGATRFGVYREPERYVVLYEIDGRYIRHTIPIAPPPKRRGKPGPAADPEREVRRRWRALVLIVKAKLELAASGDSSIEREFLADMVLAEGRTVYEAAAEGIAESYKTGVSPRFLLGAGGS